MSSNFVIGMVRTNREPDDRAPWFRMVSVYAEENVFVRGSRDAPRRVWSRYRRS